MDEENPFKAPESMPEDKIENYTFDVNRAALVPTEEDIESYEVDGHAFGQSHDAKAAMAGSIESVVNEPTAIFGGLSRQNFEREDSLAYCGRITNDGYVQYVLLVFAKRDSKSKSIVVFDWEFRLKDSAGLPINWLSDFKVRLWPKH